MWKRERKVIYLLWKVMSYSPKTKILWFYKLHVSLFTSQLQNEGKSLSTDRFHPFLYISTVGPEVCVSEEWNWLVNIKKIIIIIITLQQPVCRIKYLNNWGIMEMLNKHTHKLSWTEKNGHRSASHYVDWIWTALIKVLESIQ